MRKVILGRTVLGEKSVILTTTVDELHLIRDALWEVPNDPKYDKEEMELSKNIRNSINRILLDPYQH